MTIYHGDCREMTTALELANVIVTDPPYGVGADGGVGASNGKAQCHDWSDSWDHRIDIRFLLSCPVMIVWGFNYLADQLGAAKTILVWDKKLKNDWTDNFADVEIAWTRGVSGPSRCFRYQYMGACRGPNTSEGPKVHPTQKPLAVMKWCVSFVDGPLLDPFMGSGTTLRAAKDLGRKAIGIEIEERYCEIAAKRMAQEVLDFSEAK